MPLVPGSTFPFSGKAKNYHAIVIAVLALLGESFKLMVDDGVFGHDFVRKVKDT